MGLDNGFILKNKKDSNLNLEIAYFRNFYELDDYISSYCIFSTDCKTLFEVPLKALNDLKEELLPTVRVLIQIPERLLGNYDDSTYPKKYNLDSDELIHDEFNPITSRSAFAGWKALRLYNAVCVMIDLLNDNADYYIECYSSY